MLSNEALYDKCIKSCDERIESLKCRIKQIEIGRFMVKLMFPDEPQPENDLLQIKNWRNNIKLVSIEKCIYEAIIKKNKSLLPLLKIKYGEEMIDSLDLASQLTTSGITPEIEYLDFSKHSLFQKKYIDKICDAYSV